MNSKYLGLLAKLGKGTFHPGGPAFTHKVLAYNPPRPGSRVLDAGCGYGETSFYLASQYHCTVTGIDIQPAMIKEARKFAFQKESSGSTEFMVADITRLPFVQSYDMAIVESVLCFVSVERALHQLRRSLCPGGKIIMIEIVLRKELPASLWEKLQAFYGFHSLYTPGEMVKKMEEAGFTSVSHTTVNPFYASPVPPPFLGNTNMTIRQWLQMVKNNHVLQKCAPYIGYTSFHAVRPMDYYSNYPMYGYGMFPSPLYNGQPSFITKGI